MTTDPEDGPGDGLVRAAADFARELHAGDRRKGTQTSYFDGHLAPVAAIVAEAGGDVVQVAAAYLHDSAEDHGGQRMIHLLRERFGNEVASIVADLSDSLVDTEAGETKLDWRTRKQRYLASLATKPERSLVVAAADKLHNATAIVEDHAAHGDALWQRFTTGDGADQAWYYRSLADALQARLPGHPTVERLVVMVGRLCALAGR